jgi:hypothetical protein
VTDKPHENGSIAQALANLQTQLPEVRKAQKAVVPTRAGGSFSYSYAGLPDISKELLPLMGKLGLAWVCRPTLKDDNKLVLAYMLMHVGGERLSGEYPLTGSTPQEIGSAITYARRYVLCSITGLAADDDDDGALANQAARPPRARAEARARTETSARRERPVEPHTSIKTFTELTLALRGAQTIDAVTLIGRQALRELDEKNINQQQFDMLKRAAQTRTEDISSGAATARDGVAGPGGGPVGQPDRGSGPGDTADGRRGGPGAGHGDGGHGDAGH